MTMLDAILVVNSGSSSLKFSAYTKRGPHSLARLFKGQLDGIATRPRMKVQASEGEVLLDRSYEAGQLADHDAALGEVVAWLRSMSGQARIVAFGHRVAHGGPEFSAPSLVDEALLDALDKLIPLAPLHQPANLAPIRAILRRLPDVPQIACFDSAFHRTHPDVADRFALPDRFHQAGIRRYGFHGLSYEFISGRLPVVAPALAAGRVVVAHLGSGASLCAMKAGASIDSTMSFTALDGLPMGTRCGALDPGVVIYLVRQMEMEIGEIEDLLYRKSGLLGLSGLSNDVRDLLSSDAPAAKFAIEHFIYRVCQEIGALTAALGGIDGLVFTAGIGEHSSEIRARICRKLAWLGVGLDDAANRAGGPRITTAQSSVSAWVIPTDEEIMIARHAVNVIDGLTSATARPGIS